MHTQESASKILNASIICYTKLKQVNHVLAFSSTFLNRVVIVDWASVRDDSLATELDKEGSIGCASSLDSVISTELSWLQGSRSTEPDLELCAYKLRFNVHCRKHISNIYKINSAIAFGIWKRICITHVRRNTTFKCIYIMSPGMRMKLLVNCFFLAISITKKTFFYTTNPRVLIKCII